MAPRKQKSAPEPTRCAIYTRKSVTEGLDQDFNTLDAQREAGEAYIKSQQCEGWVCLPDQYDDGGYSGGDINRPALTHLLNDIEAGRIDCVVVYKVDRLSRSLLDFARLMEVFDEHGVSFVSVTQPINTADSTGRLMLNILLSFAQFERETIADRTRDKMSAARRKGKWCGGNPVLGYDPVDGKLVINEAEAETVRAIFNLYLKHQSVLAVVEEVNRRGWTTKSWTTKAGRSHRGGSFTKTSLHALLTNVVYIGRIKHRGEVYDGEHEGIIDEEIWNKTQSILAKNNQGGGARVKNRYGFLLKGMLRCKACDAAMSPSTTRKGTKVYRYYVCTGAAKRGWHACPSPSIAADKIERYVAEQIRVIGQSPDLVRETARQVREAKKAKVPELTAEQKRLTGQLTSTRKEITNLLDVLAQGDATVPSIAEYLGLLEDRARLLESRIAEIRDELVSIRATTINQIDLARALSLFDPIWDVLYPPEQERVIRLLIERVDFDGSSGKLGIVLHPVGIKILANEMSLEGGHGNTTKESKNVV